MRFKKLTTTFAAVGLIASVISVGGSAQAAFACGKLFVAPAGDAPNNASGGGGENLDNLDIVGGGIAAEDATTFTTSLGVKDLTMALPDNATSANWYFQWTYKEVNYFSRASVSLAAPTAPTYTFGTYDATTRRYTALGPTEGVFNEGESGTIDIVVPFETVGAPPANEELTNTFGVTFVGQGVPGGPTTLAAVDRGPKEADAFGSAYTVGGCETSGGGGSDLASPKAGLGFTDTTPKRGSTTTAKARLKICGKHAGTLIQLQRKVKGSFKTVASKKLDAECRARFKVIADFRTAEYRSFWKQQDDNHRTGKSRPVTVNTHR